MKDMKGGETYKKSDYSKANRNEGDFVKKRTIVLLI